MITETGLKKNPDLPKLINSAIIPGLQGGPHNNQTAAIAVALEEASTTKFKRYAQQIVKNSKALAAELTKHGLKLVSGGSDNHLILIDLRNKSVNGAIVAQALEVAGIVTNKNGVPFDTNPPFYPSGVRLGTPGVTTRGMKEKEMKQIAKWILAVVDHVKDEKIPEDKEERIVFMKDFKNRIAKDKFLTKIALEVKALCKKFPMPL